MTGFREELIEAMERAFLDATDDLPDDAEAGINAALDAALAFRSSVVCSQCGGRACCVITHGPDDYEDVPCPRCVDGRVPGETRLAIVEVVGSNVPGTVICRLSAPDLPEGTQE